MMEFTSACWHNTLTLLTTGI